MRVKPAAGVIVRDPKTFEPVPAEGRDVPETSYWRRRLDSGDLIPVEPGTVDLVPVDPAPLPRRRAAKQED